MVDRTGDWCFEGGCTYMTAGDQARADDFDMGGLEALYLEPCLGQYD